MIRHLMLMAAAFESGKSYPANVDLKSAIVHGGQSQSFHLVGNGVLR